MKFPLDSNISHCNGCEIENEYYERNLKNISFYTSRVKNNHFEFNNSFVNGLKGIGNSGSTGASISDNSSNWDFHFDQHTIDYNMLKIGNKGTIFRGFRNMEYFYQFNYPKSEKDTLYFICYDALYKAYIIR